MAADVHAGMIRKVGGEPYINHPVRVAARLWRGAFDEQLIAAGFLHDAVEDTPTTLAEIAACGGVEVARLVAALSEDKSISDYERRKAEHRQQIAALSDKRVSVLWCADKLINLRSLLRDYEVEGERLAARFNAVLDLKMAHTASDLEVLRAVLDEDACPILWELEDVVSEIVRTRQQAECPRAYPADLFSG